LNGFRRNILSYIKDILIMPFNSIEWILEGGMSKQ